MTLASDGSGTFAYRVTIDGCPSSPVTMAEMVVAGSAGVAARVNGLDMSGVEFTAQADPLSGKLTVGGMSLRIADIDGAWSAIFDKAPANTTWLNEELDTTEAEITVNSTAGFASAGYIWIDSECIAYTSLGGGGVTFEGCTRGSLSDDADAETYHYITNGARMRSPEVTDWPVLWEGRRVRVYRYEETDSLTGAGTQVYLGTISTSPSFDGKVWSIGVESIASILGQTLGSDLSEPSYPRGILYPPDFPCTVHIWESTTASFAAASATQTSASVTGFFETQEAFCIAMTAAIDAAQTAAGQTNDTLEAKSDGDAGWHLEYVTLSGGSQRALVIGRGRRASLVDAIFGGPNGGPQNATATEQATVAAGARYYFWPYPGTYSATGVAPRPIFTDAIEGAGTVPRGICDVAISPSADIYLGGATAVSTLISSVEIEWASERGADAVTDSYTLGAYNSTTRMITLSGLDYSLGADGGDGAGRAGSARRIWTSVSLPQIRFGLVLSEFGGLPVGVLGFMRTINDGHQQYSTLGVMPALRDGDWDVTAWVSMMAGQPQFVSRRWYSTFESISMADVVVEEVKLCRHFLAVDSSGRLVPKMIRLPAASELSTAETIGQTTLLTDEGLLSHEVSGLGQVSDVVLSTGYNPKDGKFEGRTITVRDVTAYGQSTSVRAVTIAPKSQYLGPLISDDEAVFVAAGIFGTFAGNYAVDTIDVAMHNSVQLGDPIVFDNPHYPDGSGSIGATGKVGLVIGRKAGAYSPRLQLTVLTTRQKVGGYAPAADITGSTDNGGNSWSVTLDTDLLPSGTTNAQWFAVGDRVRAVEMNTAAATVVVGTVTTAGSKVQFDGVWGGHSSGTGTWYLTMANSTDASLASTQRRFCSIATDTGVIDYASSDQPAFRFGA